MNAVLTDPDLPVESTLGLNDKKHYKKVYLSISLLLSVKQKIELAAHLVEQLFR